MCLLTNTQSRFASVVVDGVLGPPRMARHTWRCPCISVVPEATHEASRGSETGTRELLGGTEENSLSVLMAHWFALQANQWFCTKWKQKFEKLNYWPDLVPPSGEDFDDDRGGWGNKLDFLFSCISVSVGLGSKLLPNLLPHNECFKYEKEFQFWKD